MLTTSNTPRNESKEHYELKQIAKIIAKQRGCQIVADEVLGFGDSKICMSKNGVVDVAGAKLTYKTAKKSSLEILTYGYEAKASLADFKNGFNAGADYTYIIAPQGVIPHDLIPEGVGLYEVDLENYRLSHLRKYSGINLSIKPKKRHKYSFETELDMMINIARRSTNIDLYKHCDIYLVES